MMQRITHVNFKDKIDHLSDYYKKNYPKEVIAVFYNRLKNYSIDQVEEILTHIKASNRFAPLLPDFQKAIEELQIKPSFTNSYQDCDYCLNTGWLDATTADHHRCNIRCNCNWGKDLYAKAPIINSTRRDLTITKHSNSTKVLDDNTRIKYLNALQKYLDGSTANIKPSDDRKNEILNDSTLSERAKINLLKYHKIS